METTALPLASALPIAPILTKPLQTFNNTPKLHLMPNIAKAATSTAIDPGRISQITRLAYTKLSRETHSEGDLRRLVCHLNLLDDLTAESPTIVERIYGRMNQDTRKALPVQKTWPMNIMETITEEIETYGVLADTPTISSQIKQGTEALAEQSTSIIAATLQTSPTSPTSPQPVAAAAMKLLSSNSPPHAVPSKAEATTTPPVQAPMPQRGQPVLSSVLDDLFSDYGSSDDDDDDFLDDSDVFKF